MGERFPVGKHMHHAAASVLLLGVEHLESPANLTETLEEGFVANVERYDFVAIPVFFETLNAGDRKASRMFCTNIHTIHSLRNRECERKSELIR